MIVMRVCQWILLGSLLVGSTGCSFFHDLKPHRLHRLNRVPDMMDDNAYNFSIPPEPIPDGNSATSPSIDRAMPVPTGSSNRCSD